MTSRFSNWFKAMVVLQTLSACGSQPIDIPDFVVTGWLGPAGGTQEYCSTVHTNTTTIAPVHHTLNECLGLLTGAIIIDGAAFNTLIAGRDKLCAEAGSCTYEQAAAAQKLRLLIAQVQKVNPRRRRHREP